jgi:hypothetical protein
MPTTEHLTPDGFAHQLGARALHCRELGHTWRAWTVDYDQSATLFTRQLRCSSCHSIRKQELGRDGDIISNGYTYAPGYLATNVDGRVDRSVFRLESLTRFLERGRSELKAV